LYKTVFQAVKTRFYSQYSEKKKKLNLSIMEIKSAFDSLLKILKIHPELENKFPPPQIICFGNEHDGKSSTLERIFHGPFFPRACTKCAIRVESRHTMAGNPTVTIKTRERIKLENGIIEYKLIEFVDRVPVDEVSEVVSSKMNELDGGKVTSKYDIVVTIKGLDFPNLDLVDLPGFFLSGYGGDSVVELAEDFIEHERNHSIFLLVLRPDGTAVRLSQGANLVKYKLESRTFGIVTNVDRCTGNKQQEEFFKALLKPERYPQLPEEFKVNLQERWFLTSSKPPANALSLTNSERLAKVEEDETEFWQNSNNLRFVNNFRRILNEVDIPFHERTGFQVIRQKIQQYYDDYFVHICLEHFMSNFLKDYVCNVHLANPSSSC
jgi:hypothetical protein